MQPSLRPLTWSLENLQSAKMVSDNIITEVMCSLHLSYLWSRRKSQVLPIPKWRILSKEVTPCRFPQGNNMTELSYFQSKNVFIYQLSLSWLPIISCLPHIGQTNVLLHPEEAMEQRVSVACIRGLQHVWELQGPGGSQLGTRLPAMPQYI